MAKVNLDPYLFFQGNCKEAMEFYKAIFGGDLQITNVEDQPGDFPEKESMKGMVMHSLLDGEVRLMGSDSPKASSQAAKIELSLSGDDEEKLRQYWDGLSQGGKVRFPLEKAPWGDIYGMLTDKFGVDWMVNITAKKA